MKKILTTLLIAATIVVSSTILADSIKNLRTNPGTVTVKGLAEMPVTAESASWPLVLKLGGNELALLQEKLQKDLQATRAFLVGQGIPAEDITLQPLRVEDAKTNTYRRDFASRYSIEAQLVVQTTEIQAVQTAAAQTDKLIAQGIVLTGWERPRYIFSGVNDVKPELIKEATQNARLTAQQFAEDSGTKVGQIQFARQGMIQILGRTSAISEREQPEKTLRVVTTIDYLLK